jgi:hypothetical protein
VVFGNQQYTVRNLTFYNAVTAISQIWDWGWTYTGISINNCTTGLNMAAGGRTAQSVGSVTFLDSTFTNTKVAIVTAHDSSSLPATAGSLILDNIVLSNTPIAVQGPSGTTALAGGSLTISGWGEGHEYTVRDFQLFSLSRLSALGSLLGFRSQKSMMLIRSRQITKTTLRKVSPNSLDHLPSSRARTSTLGQNRSIKLQLCPRLLACELEEQRGMGLLMIPLH